MSVNLYAGGILHVDGIVASNSRDSRAMETAGSQQQASRVAGSYGAPPDPARHQKLLGEFEAKHDRTQTSNSIARNSDAPSSNPKRQPLKVLKVVRGVAFRLSKPPAVNIDPEHKPDVVKPKALSTCTCGLKPLAPKVHTS